MIIYCDGGKKGGVTYGSYKIYTNNKKLLYHGVQVFGDGTSNTAEYLSMLSALKKAREFDREHILILSDSKLVVNQVKGNWVCNYKHLENFRDLVRAEIDKLESVEIKYTPRNNIVRELGH